MLVVERSGTVMDAVRATIESLGGNVELHTEIGVGTRTGLSVPIAAAVQRVLLVACGRQRVALPIIKVERVLELPASSVERSAGESFTLIDNEPTLVIDLAARLALVRASVAENVLLVLSEVRGEMVALEVDRVEGQQEIYLKPVPEMLSAVKVLAVLSVLGD